QLSRRPSSGCEISSAKDHSNCTDDFFKYTANRRGWAKGATMAQLARLLRDEGGATTIEYGLTVALLALMLVTGLNAVAGGLGGLMTTVSGTVRDAACSGSCVTTRWVP